MYAETAQAQQLRPTPELGRLKAAAERISVATLKVDNFLDRFHGPRPECATNAPGPNCDSYRNDIEAVFVQLERLESAVAALDHIG